MSVVVIHLDGAKKKGKLHVCPGHYGTVVGSRARGRSRDARETYLSQHLVLFTLPCLGTGAERI